MRDASDTHCSFLAQWEQSFSIADTKATYSTSDDSLKSGKSCFGRLSFLWLGRPVKSLGYLARVLVFSAAIAATTGSFAGPIGPRSRATVVISVTIPQRLEARHRPGLSAENLSRRSAPQWFCLISTGSESTYSVTLLATPAPANGSSLPSVAWGSGQSGSQAAQLRPGETVSGFQAGTAESCQSGGSGAAQLSVAANESSNQAPNADTQLTLLIAAD